MKKMLFTLVTLLAVTLNAKGMTYEQARNEALFLTDKMAYELNLTDEQYEAAYEINLDYLMGVTSQADVFGPYWERRNLDLSYILYSWQWEAFRAASYFFRPLYWDAGYWHFGIYARYPHRDYFYFGRPHFYATYRGGHSWRMNGGRSFYEGRRDHFRSQTHDRHIGMRDNFDNGHFRNMHGNSSTRITAGRNGRMNRNDRGRNDRMDRNGNFGTGVRSRSGNFSGRRGANERSSTPDVNRNDNRSGNRSGSFSGSSGSSTPRTNSSFGGNTTPRSNNFNGSSSSPRTSGSFSGGSSSSRTSGSFSSSSSSRTSGSFSGGSSSSRTSGSFSGSRSSSTRSSGSFGGGSSSRSNGGSRSSGSFSGGGSRGGGGGHMGGRR